MEAQPTAVEGSVFVSAPSTELMRIRQQLTAFFRARSRDVIVQEEFASLSQDNPLADLSRHIASSVAVVQVLGEVPGEVADGRAVDRFIGDPGFRELLREADPAIPDQIPKAHSLTFTQWESWLALLHQKPLFAFATLCTPPNGKSLSPGERSQAEHVAAIRAMCEVTSIRGIQDLTRELARAIDRRFPGLLPAFSGQLPPSQGSAFIGRDEDLAALRSIVLDESKRGAVRRVTVTGPPGAGKTSLAIELAHSLSSEFPHQFLVSGASSDHLRRGLLGIVGATGLNLDSADMDDEQRLQHLGEWLSCSAGWVLIVDEVGDDLRGSALVEFLHTAKGGVIAYTSTSLVFEPATEYAIEGLTPSVAGGLLGFEAGGSRAISDILSGEPGALILASNTIAALGLEVSEYANALGAMASEQSGSSARALAAQMCVQRLSRPAFSLCALSVEFGVSSFPARMADSELARDLLRKHLLLDEAQLEDAVKELLETGLWQVPHHLREYRVLPEVRVLFRRMGQDHVDALLLLLAGEAPMTPREPTSWTGWSEIESAMWELIDRYSLVGFDHAVVLNGFATYLAYARKDLESAEEVFGLSLEALRDHEFTVEADSIFAIGVLQNLGSVCSDRGDLQAAYSAFEEALSRTDREISPGFEGRTILLGNLSGVCLRMRDIDGAVGFAREALAEAHNEDARIIALRNLSHSLFVAKSLDESESLALECLELCARYGSQREETMEAKKVLADVFKCRGRLKEALSLMREVVFLAAGMHGDSSPVTQIHRLSFADILLRSGEGSEAESLYRKASSSLAVSYGPAHPLVLDGRLRLAGLVRRSRGRAAALELLEEDEPIARATHGDESELTRRIVRLIQKLRSE